MSKKAFTLVELVIAIAVIGVLAAVLVIFMPNVVKMANKKSALSDAKNAITNYVEKQDGAIAGDFVIVVKKNKELYLFGYTSEDDKVVESEVLPYAETGDGFASDAMSYVDYAQSIEALKKRPAFSDISNSIAEQYSNVRIFAGCCLKTLLQGKDISVGVGDIWYLEPGDYRTNDISIATIDTNGTIKAETCGTTYIYNGDVLEYTLNVYEYIDWNGDFQELISYVENADEPIFLKQTERHAHYNGNGDIFPIVIPQGKTVGINCDHFEIACTAQYVEGGAQPSFEASMFENHGDLRFANGLISFDNNSDSGFFANNIDGNIVMTECSVLNLTDKDYIISNSSSMSMHDCDIADIHNGEGGAVLLSDCAVGTVTNEGNLRLDRCVSNTQLNSLTMFIVNSGHIDSIKDCEFTTFGSGSLQDAAMTEQCSIENSGTISEIVSCSFAEADLEQNEYESLVFIKNTGTIESVSDCTFNFMLPENENAHTYESVSGIVISAGAVGRIANPSFIGIEKSIVVSGGELTNKLSDGAFSHQPDSHLIASGYQCKFNSETSMYNIVAE